MVSYILRQQVIPKFQPFLLIKKIINKYSTTTKYETLKTGIVGAKKNIGLITLHRPKHHNALSSLLLSEFMKVIDIFESEENIAAIILTGNEKAFVSGGDIKEMLKNTYSFNQRTNFLQYWECVHSCEKPIVAAVNGYVVGGGLELALLCDIIFAGEKATFGLPEICIGTIPGAGGSHRLPRYVGKSKAIEMVLSGNFINAYEAEKMGLVSRVFSVGSMLEETIKVVDVIASKSPLIVKMAKQAINAAYETTLKSGLLFEKLMFYGSLATQDSKVVCKEKRF